MHGRGRVFGRGRPSSYRALPVTNPRSSRELMRAHASSTELTRAHASSRELMRVRAAAASTRSPQPIRWVRRSRGPHYGRRVAAHAAGSPVQSGAIRRNQEAIRRPSEGPSEAFRDHQRGHQRPSEANQRPLRGDHLRALEIAISLESVDQTCGERRRGERLHAEAPSRLPSRSRA